MGCRVSLVIRINRKLYYEKESVIMNNKSKWIKAIGVAATVIGVGVNLITDWVNEQKMDEKIEEKVSEALVRRDKDEAEES